MKHLSELVLKYSNIITKTFDTRLIMQDEIAALK